MNTQQLNALCTERINRLAPYIRTIPDEDMRQEAMIGAYTALKVDPNGTDRYLINRAKWNQVTALRKGCSFDNGFYKRKELTVFRYTQLPSADSVFAEAISNYGATPLDEQVINKICLERLMESLTGLERRFLKYKVVEEWSNNKIVKLLHITKAKLKEIKTEIRLKIELAFA